jgi:hypothetical protein
VVSKTKIWIGSNLLPSSSGIDKIHFVGQTESEWLKALAVLLTPSLFYAASQVLFVPALDDDFLHLLFLHHYCSLSTCEKYPDLLVDLDYLPEMAVSLAARDDASCPTGNGTIWTSPQGFQYELYCDYNFPGNDLPATPAKSFSECIETCDAYKQDEAVLSGANCIAAIYGAANPNGKQVEIILSWAKPIFNIHQEIHVGSKAKLHRSRQEGT